MPKIIISILCLNFDIHELVRVIQSFIATFIAVITPPIMHTTSDIDHNHIKVG